MVDETKKENQQLNNDLAAKVDELEAKIKHLTATVDEPSVPFNSERAFDSKMSGILDPEKEKKMNSFGKDIDTLSQKVVELEQANEKALTFIEELRDNDFTINADMV